MKQREQSSTHKDWRAGVGLDFPYITLGLKGFCLRSDVKRNAGA